MMRQNLSRLPLPLLFLVSCGMLGLTGCLTSGKKAVFIQPSDNLVRIGPNVKGRVYVWDGKQWELSRNKVTIPEGWMAGPLNLPEGEAE